MVVMDPGGASGTRRIKAIYELDQNARKLMPIVTLNNESDTFEPQDLSSIAKNSFRLTHVLDEDIVIDELSHRALFLSRLVSRGVFSLDRLSKELQRFYIMEEGELLAQYVEETEAVKH